MPLTLEILALGVVVLTILVLGPYSLFMVISEVALWVAGLSYSYALASKDFHERLFRERLGSRAGQLSKDPSRLAVVREPDWTCRHLLPASKSCPDCLQESANSTPSLCLEPGKN